jgi:MYXO-CTERM domain-containing protein
MFSDDQVYGVCTVRAENGNPFAMCIRRFETEVPSSVEKGAKLNTSRSNTSRSQLRKGLVSRFSAITLLAATLLLLPAVTAAKPHHKHSDCDDFWNWNSNGCKVTPMPEPSALPMLAAGLAGLAAFGWGIRRAAKQN